MRKWTATLSAVALLACQAAYADGFISNIKWDGSLEVLGVSADNEADFDKSTNDHRGDTVTRLQFGASMDVTEGVKGRVLLMRNPQSAGMNAVYGSTSHPTSLQSEQDSIVVENAYLDIANLFQLDNVRIGRQWVGRQGDLVVYFGPVNDDSLSSSALDALCVWKKFGPVNTHFGTGKVFNLNNVPGSGGAATGAGDVNATWLLLSSDELVKTQDITIPLEVGYYDLKSSGLTSATSDNSNIVVMDLRAGVKAMDNQLKGGLEYAMNGGKLSDTPEVKLKGSAIVLNAAFDSSETNLNVHVNYATLSGDDNPADNERKDFFAVKSDYRYGEILSNDTELGGAGNLVGDALLEGINALNIGGSYPLPFWDKKWTAKADYYMVNANKVQPGAEKGIGNELDLALGYMHNDNVGVTLGWAMLDPKTGFVTSFSTTPGSPKTDVVNKLYAKLMVKFGQK